MYMRKLLLINLLLMSVLLMQAQTYCGLHKYDGEHKNEVSGYMMGGSNVVSDAFFGFEGSYLRHLTDRWHVGGDMQKAPICAILLTAGMWVATCRSSLASNSIL